MRRHHARIPRHSRQLCVLRSMAVAHNRIRHAVRHVLRGRCCTHGRQASRMVRPSAGIPPGVPPLHLRTCPVHIPAHPVGIGRSSGRVPHAHPPQTEQPPATMQVAVFQRAVSGTRTRDPWLGKPMLYQLSYYRNGIILQIYAAFSVFQAFAAQNLKNTSESACTARPSSPQPRALHTAG